MSLLPQSALNALRGVTSRMHDKTAQILRNTPARDADGGQTDARAVVRSYSCYLWADRSTSALMEMAQDDREQPVAVWKVSLPYDADVRDTDQLQIGDKRLEVTGSNRGASDMTGLTLICREVS